ncbi:MAG: DUF1501 domain-containing protein [Phycisphaeraceae bacterium]|nr:DUF1501 domain-containing protein [Phycisphaeraceae bacterium]MCP4498296.1 DUF1501 domain-containing protein [Phycisphaeraceae bacterium]MCP4939199.1 DUF1501 domain-containing protein [Phycisphaeraceae bacterium]
MLRQVAGGFGLAAFAALGHEERAVASSPNRVGRDGMLPSPHHAAKARSVIFLYMDGGPGQMDTFDPKPRLTDMHGRPFPMEKSPTQFDSNGNCLGTPWEFRPGGESGTPVSDLFPHVREMADEILVVRSMTSPFNEHTNANYFLHTGLGLAGRPSMGAWATYGLGSENRDLPGFVVLDGGLIPPGGLACFGNAYLPATHQASVLRPAEEVLANVKPRESIDRQRRKLGLVEAFDRGIRASGDDRIESAIRNQELAFRMQFAVPEATNVDEERDATRRAYGFESDYEPTRIFARECLLARRLVERGVRFIECTCPQVSGDRWDQHGKLKEGHENNARAVDQPIAALLADLKQRGLLDSTLVIWGAEFGRTPFSQGSDGRDHNQHGFSMWLAGGGIDGGRTYGSTDEYGYRAVENPVEIHDLHATMLHLMGIDHERLTVRFGGRDMRLTDVHGKVMHDWIA